MFFSPVKREAGEQQFGDKVAMRTEEGWHGGGWPASRRGGRDAALSEGIELCSLVLSHLTVVGANWSLPACCLSFVPCFKTFIEHLPCAQCWAQGPQ